MAPMKSVPQSDLIMLLVPVNDANLTIALRKLTVSSPGSASKWMARHGMGDKL